VQGVERAVPGTKLKGKVVSESWTRQNTLVLSVPPTRRPTTQSTCSRLLPEGTRRLPPTGGQDGTTLDIGPHVLTGTFDEASALLSGSGTTAPLAAVVYRYILGVLRQTGWVVEGPRGAATILGLHPNTLRSRMRKLGIHRPAPDPS
jgi:transcriptional regulator with GAF, ATPase, and Fis domain